MNIVRLLGKNKTIILDQQHVAVNVNIGVTKDSFRLRDIEKEKIDQLFKISEPPDMLMDLSLSTEKGYLYDYIINNYGCPVGIIPCYFSVTESGTIDKEKLLFEIERAASAGISWMVFHFSLTKEMVSIAAKNRKYVLSSRSAAILLKDMIVNNRDRCIYWEILDDIIEIAKKYSVVISLGAAFRPADIDNTLDEVHTREIQQYSDLATLFTSHSISVMAEGVGHCDINKLDVLISALNKIDVPIMPLGPLFGNHFSNDEHIINAMGFYASIIRGANFRVINSITSEEHSGGIPTETSIIEGYKAAKSCSQLCNDYLGSPRDRYIDNRCLNMDIKNCERCAVHCPLTINMGNEHILKWLVS